MRNDMWKRLFMMAAVLCLLTDIAAQQQYVFPEDIKPLIKTRWGQMHPFNLLCPKYEKNEETAHMLAGCGPVAMAQIVNYHRFPSMSPDGTYEYDWELMFPHLRNGLEKEEVVAVAKLISDCGVSSFTKYGEGASSTSLSYVMGALKRLFGYSNDMCIYARDSFQTSPSRDSLYLSLLFSELKAGRPVLYRGSSPKTQEGHLFIIDGCKGTKVHVNMGWAGTKDGYYLPDQLDGYEKNQWMLIEVADTNYHAPVLEVTLSAPGSLDRELTAQERLTARHIKLSGKMDKRDFPVLKQMIMQGLLRTIDMEQVDMKELPDSAFFECTYLSHFIAPHNLQRTGIRTFYRCRNLNYAVFHEGLRRIDRGAFSGCVNLLKADLPTTLTMIGPNAFTSCEALLTAHIPEGTSTIGNYAFSYCNNLFSIYLPRSLKSIGKEAFKECPKLSRITLDPNNSHLRVDGLNIIPQDNPQK